MKYVLVSGNSFVSSVLHILQLCIGEIMEIKLLSCPLCLKPHFDGVDTLRASLIAAATSQISCPVCNDSLMGLDKLTIHLFSHITNTFVRETSIHPEPQIITVAPEARPIEAEIKNAEAQLDEKSRTIRCDICNFSFSDENILDMHQKLLHQTLADKNTGIYSYHCHLCSKKFKMRGSLMVHLRVAHYGFGHHNDSGLEKLQGAVAETKGKTIKTEEKIDESKANAKQWSCDVCSKLFTTKYFLKKHKRLHTGEMPYFCAQCNKYFTFQQSYHKHMLYHSSEKPHICGECGRAFKELSTLHNHERIHSGERPFACETCGKCFRQRVSYLVHKRIHTGVMPYKCTACEKTFRYKVSQRSHKCPVSPPGSVVRTTSSDTQLLPATKTTDTLQMQPVLAPTPMNSLNTIVFNAQGEIIGQNFAFDGKSIITYTNIHNCGQLKTQENPTKLVNQEFQETAHYSNTASSDFFAMVMSPPLPDVESLCLSNSSSSHSGRNDKQALETINEQSLKELLYGQTNSPG